MMRYSVQPRNWIFVKGYGFLSFAKNMGKNIGENMSKNVSSKYSQKLLDHAKESVTDAFETASKRAVQKIEETTGHLIGNKSANKITKVSWNSQQHNSEAVTNENDKKIPKEILKERYISLEERQKITDNLKLI